MSYFGVHTVLFAFVSELTVESSSVGTFCLTLAIVNCTLSLTVGVSPNGFIPQTRLIFSQPFARSPDSSFELAYSYLTPPVSTHSHVLYSDIIAISHYRSLWTWRLKRLASFPMPGYAARMTSASGRTPRLQTFSRGSTSISGEATTHAARTTPTPTTKPL